MWALRDPPSPTKQQRVSDRRLQLKDQDPHGRPYMSHNSLSGGGKKKSPRGMIHVLMRPVRTAAQGKKADKKTTPAQEVHRLLPIRCQSGSLTDLDA